MKINEQIQLYIKSLPEAKSKEMLELHSLILQLFPKSKLWFLDGKNSENKIVANPNIGYGLCNINYTNDKTKEFYKLGISATQTGISVYIFGINDKAFLSKTIGNRIGKATVSGYCIKFKTLQDIDIEVLKEIIHFALAESECDL